MIKLLENYYDNVVPQLRKINEENSLVKILLQANQYSKHNQIFYFTHFWYHIPKKYLYEEYKDAFTMVEGNYYTKFFHPQLIERIMKYNAEDTVNNPELIKQLDDDGYLTVYHGHCKPTLRYSNSWTTNKDKAKWFGNRNAMFSGYRNRNKIPSDTYYVVTGKVKLKDVIAYITDRNESEIVVQVKNVKDRSKEFYPYEM